MCGKALAYDTCNYRPGEDTFTSWRHFLGMKNRQARPQLPDERGWLYLGEHSNGNQADKENSLKGKVGT